MTRDHVTLKISEAFREGGISPTDFLPPVIVKPHSNSEVKFVLSEKEDGYYTATLEGCSCDQFLSGVYPCPHHNRAWISDVRKLAKQKDHLKREQEKEERLKKKEPEIYFKMKQGEEDLKRKIFEKNLKRKQEEECLKRSGFKSKRKYSLEERDEFFKRAREKNSKKNDKYFERDLIEEQELRQRKIQEQLERYNEHIIKGNLQNIKPDQTTAPKKKARFYSNDTKKLEMPVIHIIDTLEEDHDYYRDLFG